MGNDKDTILSHCLSHTDLASRWQLQALQFWQRGYEIYCEHKLED
jgi:hypothetical protein